MDTLTAKFSINTPMFMSGANQTLAEIRATSMKGIIRFWWRALHFAKFKTLAALKEHEEELFGNTKKQSAVRFVIDHDTSQLSFNTPPAQPAWLDGKKGCIYLGYGVMDTYGKLTHPCIQHNKFFTLKLIARNKIDSSIVNAVKLFGLIGGAGAKSRKGYGSLTLVDLQQNDVFIPCPQDMESYQRELAKLLCDSSNFHIPTDTSFTAFSNISRVATLLSGTDPITLLNTYGETMQLYRSWGRNNNGRHELPNGRQAEQNFKNDHDWFKEKYFPSNHPDFHPERTLFGLPHSYYSQGQSASVRPARYERRGSPLFFHVHKLSDNNYIGVSILLPSKFLPDEEGGSITANNKNIPLLENNYQVLTRFLEGKKGHRTRKTEKQYFPERKQLWPEKEEKQS